MAFLSGFVAFSTLGLIALYAKTPNSVLPTFFSSIEVISLSTAVFF